MEYTKDTFVISTDKSRLDLQGIYDFLQSSYWAKGIPLAVVRRSIENSLCFGVYEGDRQIGFARVVSDLATFAYLADVFMLETYRGRGLGKWLISCILADPRLADLRRWVLVTKDAQGLYREFDFQPLNAPERYMEILNSDVYARPGSPPQKVPAT